MTTEMQHKENGDEASPIERLVAVADAAFARANALDGIKLAKKDDEAARTIAEARDDAFAGCVQVWRVILQMLPTSELDAARRKELTRVAHKVKSRCHHRLGDLDAAKIAIAKAIDAGYHDGFISLGAIAMDLKQWEEAEAAFRSALAKGVQEMRAHAGLGELYFSMGTEKLKADPGHTAFFVRAEEEFIAAGRERFAEGFERAMDLFETIGWKDRALTFGNRAKSFYEEHRASYGGKLRALDVRLRRLTGEERRDRIVEGVGRKLGEVLGGKKEK
jgi:tetratricopeptide (TPR) repeat protein